VEVDDDGSEEKKSQKGPPKFAPSEVLGLFTYQALKSGNYPKNQQHSNLDTTKKEVSPSPFLLYTVLLVLSHLSFPLQQYLSEKDFLSLFNMPRDKFAKLAYWKQISLKKEVGLF
jgi:hypothetical protein